MKSEGENAASWLAASVTLARYGTTVKTCDPSGPRIWTRRRVLLTSFATLASTCAPLRAALPVIQTTTPRALAEIESKVGGRVGVFALDTGTGKELAHREDERFAMCSTFKWVLSAAILARVDRGQLSLDGRVPYGSTDLLDYAPVTRAQVADGYMTVGALARASVVVSDNTAANLLLGLIDGPPGLTQFIRSMGDPVTRLDRTEPTLNSNEPGDTRDTTSPRAMVSLMRKILCGDALSSASRERLLAWLRACETGKDRLRAGLPGDWTVGDKTGGGLRGALNDVAIAVPPGGDPILIASYLSEGRSGLDEKEAAHADVGRVVARALGVS